MIRLFYFKNNYGDDLSAYLVSRLSGEGVVSCTPLTLKRFLLDWMIRGRDLLFFKGFHNFSFSYARKSRILFAVGSIIGLGRSNCTIWGSGITYGNDPIDPAMERKNCLSAIRDFCFPWSIQTGGKKSVRSD